MEDWIMSKFMDWLFGTPPDLTEITRRFEAAITARNVEIEAGLTLNRAMESALVKATLALEVERSERAIENAAQAEYSRSHVAALDALHREIALLKALKFPASRSDLAKAQPRANNRFAKVSV
jgi:hypothetical protein